jgi:hypothetical protein
MSYVNNQLIECMRTTSTEKTSGNNNEVAQFTNKLNQAVILNVGDQISIERAFINGLGAGNQNTIQFSGRKHQAERNRTQKYTEVIPNNFQDNTRISPYRMGYYLSYEVQEKKMKYQRLKMMNHQSRLDIILIHATIHHTFNFREDLLQDIMGLLA